MGSCTVSPAAGQGAVVLTGEMAAGCQGVLPPFLSVLLRVQMVAGEEGVKPVTASTTEPSAPRLLTICTVSDEPSSLSCAEAAYCGKGGGGAAS